LIDDVPELGVGLVYFSELEELRHSIDLTAYDLLEIEPQTFWSVDAAGEIAVNFGKLAELAALPTTRLVHSVGLPIGNSAAPGRDALKMLADNVRLLHPPFVSEHLSFNRVAHPRGERWTGFLLPPQQSLDTVAVAVERLLRLREALNVPVAFETGVNYFPPRDDEIEDGQFFAAIAEHAECGILLDLHNLLANERNGHQSVESVLEAIPFERVWEIHVAGGHFHRGFYLDAHHGLVARDLRLLAEHVVPRLPNLRAIVFEAHPDSLREVERTQHEEQLGWLHDLWATRGRIARPARAVASRQRLPEFTEARSRVARYERETSDRVERGEAPAYGLVRELIGELRGGMLLKSTPLVTRLLLASLGVKAFQAIFERYCREVPPAMFPAQEGAQFLTFLEGDLADVPCLRETIAFERAVLDVVATGRAKRAYFPYHPGQLFIALGNRSRPIITDRQPYEIEVRPHGICLRQVKEAAPQPKAS
jgi:uncharacterized protein